MDKYADVYLIRTDDPYVYKIGYSSWPETRIQQMKYSYRYTPLEIVATISTPMHKEIESALHRYFADYRVSGEFFRFDANVLKHVLRVFQSLNGTIDEGRIYKKAQSIPNLGASDYIDIKNTIEQLEERFVNKASHVFSRKIAVYLKDYLEACEYMNVSKFNHRTKTLAKAVQYTSRKLQSEYNAALVEIGVIRQKVKHYTDGDPLPFDDI